jgi:hypothetical protein
MDGIGPDGDVYVMQQQYVPLDMLGQMPEPAPAPATASLNEPETNPPESANAAA